MSGHKCKEDSRGQLGVATSQKNNHIVFHNIKLLIGTQSID